MKKYFIYIIPFALLAIFFSVVAGYFINKDSPKVIEELLEKSKNNKSLMDKIGGYRSYEYTFKTNDLKTDSLPFEMTIFGWNKQ